MIYQNVNFNPTSWAGGAADIITFARNFWSIMAGGGLVDDTVAGHLSNGTLAHPKFVNAGADSHFQFEFAHTEFLVEVAGAYNTQADMNGDLAPAAGTLVNCWDADPTKRGRYVKTGGSGTGSWTLESATPWDKAWTDYNHPQRLLELLICSYVKTTATTLPAFMSNRQGWVGPTAGGISDWRNVRVTLDMGCQDLWLGPLGKIGLHVQGNVPSVAAALTAAYGEGEKSFLPNFIQTRQLISDQLGFGADSWGKPNDVNVVRASGRRNVVVDFRDEESDWECLGDSGRSPVGRIVNYGRAPIGEVLQNLVGNAYVMAHHPEPRDGNEWFTVTSADRVSDFDRVRGRIMLYGIKIEDLA